MKGGRRFFEKGIRFEYKVKKYLESLPEVAKVIRNPRSQFPDLWVISRGVASAIAIECKKTNKELNEEEIQMAKKLIEDGISIKLAYENEKKQIQFRYPIIC